MRLRAGDVGIVTNPTTGEELGTVGRTALFGTVAKALGPFAGPDDYLVQVEDEKLRAFIGERVVVMPVYPKEEDEG